MACVGVNTREMGDLLFCTVRLVSLIVRCVVGKPINGTGVMGPVVFRRAVRKIVGARQTDHTSGAKGGVPGAGRDRIERQKKSMASAGRAPDDCDLAIFAIGGVSTKRSKPTRG
jgi:hypothetical protein